MKFQLGSLTNAELTQAPNDCVGCSGETLL